MITDGTRNLPVEERPPWWKIGLASLTGVVAGAFVCLVILLPITFLLEQLFGRSGWQESMENWSEPVRLGMLILFWAFPLTLGQWFSARNSSWSKAVYFAAALQCMHMAYIFPASAFILLWILPALIALGLIKSEWAADAAKRGRNREAKRAASHE